MNNLFTPMVAASIEGLDRWIYCQSRSNVLLIVACRVAEAPCTVESQSIPLELVTFPPAGMVLVWQLGCPVIQGTVTSKLPNTQRG